MRYLIILLLFVCSACIQIGNDPQPQQYYLLESFTEIPHMTYNNSLNIDLELIDFPDHLDRLQIVTLNDKNQIDYSDNDRWAEPLQGNITRTIRENISLMLPNADITVGPWESGHSEGTKIKVMINKFYGQLNGITQVDIRWIIENGRDQAIKGHFVDQQSIGDNYRDLVIALNEGINRFSQKVVNNLAN